MNTFAATCPQCRTALPADAPQGLCPACLLAAVDAPTEAGAAPSRKSPPPTLEQVAAAFPQLEILELIGAGGMGFVFKARQPKLDRLVALKLLPPHLGADAAFAERFEREGRVLARLSHPNIVTIHDFGFARAGGLQPPPPLAPDTTDGSGKSPEQATPGIQLETRNPKLETGFYYLLMEFVDGVNLRQAMRAGRFTPTQALEVVPKICEALQFAHEQGVLHRDIKPENILLDAKGRVKLADFGIAKLTHRDGDTPVPEFASEPPIARNESAPVPELLGDKSIPLTALTSASAALGTPNYMAPEQRDRPAAVDHRADIYSLGVVFYEMLTGELPQGKFPAPSAKTPLDPRVDAVVLRALEHERDRRQQSAGEMKTQVETIATTPGSNRNEEKAIGGGKHPVEVSQRFSRTAIVGACLAALGLLSVMISFSVDQSAPGPAIAAGVVLPNQPVMSVAFALAGAAFLYLFLATLLGWIAVSQIRRSAGKLYGLWLAVFDGLLFPLLAMNAVGVGGAGVVLRAALAMDTPFPFWLMLLLVLAAIGLGTMLIAANVFIIRRVWRAVTVEPVQRDQTVGEMRTPVETVVSTPDGSRREEARSASQPPRLFKTGTATLTTPAELATLSGQFFCYQTRGQLILDDRQLTHSCRGVTTVIPLAAIRDVSIGQYPRSMNPVGISLLSLTYEEAGQRRQILLSPMEGWFAFPGTWDALVADWHNALREAVRAATGKLPGSTPREQLGVPRGFPWVLPAMIAVPVLISAGLLSFIFNQTRTATNSGSGMMPVIFFTTLVLLLAPMGFFWVLHKQRKNTSPPPTPPHRSAAGDLALMCLMFGLPMGLIITVFSLLTRVLAPPAPVQPGDGFIPGLLGHAIVIPFLTLYLLPRWGRKPRGSQSTSAPHKPPLWPTFALAAFCAPLLVHLMMLATGQTPPEPAHPLNRIAFSFPGTLVLAAFAGAGLWLRHRREGPSLGVLSRSQLVVLGLALLFVPLVINLLVLPASRMQPEPARSGAALPIGFPESIILAVLGGLGLARWFRRPAASAEPKFHGRSLLATALICLGMIIGGMKIQEASRTHFQKVNALTSEIPRLQQQWMAAGTGVIEAQTELNRHLVQEPLARTDAERQRFLIERGRLEGEVSKAKVRRDTIHGQIQTTHDTLGSMPFPNSEALVLVLQWSLPFIFPGLLVLAWPRRKPAPGEPRSWKSAGLLMLLMQVLLFVLLFSQFSDKLRFPPPLGVTHCEVSPVGVSNNVVIVAVTTEVRRGSAELVVGFTGPRLSPETEAALREQFFPPFAGIFVKPMAHRGNFPSRIQPVSHQTWLLGFVLPDAALAQQAFASIRPIGPLPAEPGRVFAGTLFAVRQTNGAMFEATFQVAAPITSADPNWVTVSGQSSSGETALSLNWELLASQPGTVRFKRDSNTYSTHLSQLDAGTQLYRLPIHMELTKVGTNRVLLITKNGGATSREEFPGNFSALSAELRRTAANSVKTVRGATIELCEVQGQPFTVQVEATAPRFDHVVISRDQAVLNQRHFAGEGMIFTFGTGTNRWTPGGRDLDALFDITLESGWFVRGVNWVVKSRHGTIHNYRLDGPTGSLVGKLAFHPGTPAPEADGSCLIGEFQPQSGAPLPITVRLDGDSKRSAAPTQPETTRQPNSGQYGIGSARDITVWALILVGVIVLGGVALVILLVRKGGTALKIVVLGLGGLFVGFLVIAALFFSVRAKSGMSYGTVERMELEALTTQLPSTQPGHVIQTQNGFRLKLPPHQLATFEFAIRQPDDSWQPVPSLSALVATGGQAAQHDTLWWRLRRGDRGEGTNHLWFWSVLATANGGQALPQLPDHGTNVTHRVAPNETLEWWQLALPANVTLNPGEQRDIPLFRTLGSATAGNAHPREARVRVRCVPVPPELKPASTQQLIELGLDANARLAGMTANSSAIALPPTHIDFKILRVENPPGTRDIRLHFERDTNYGLALEVTQDVTVPRDSQPPKEHYRSWEQKTWVGLNGGRLLTWTLPGEFSPQDAARVAREIESRVRKWGPLPDGAVPEFATVTHRDGWKYHLFARVLREPGSPRPPAPAGALFTAEQAIDLPSDARVRLNLTQAGKDGRKTKMDGGVVFKTGPHRATGIILRWRAYPAQQGKFGNQWSLDLVDPDTGIAFHRVENSFSVPVSAASPEVSTLPTRAAPIQLVAPGSLTFVPMLHATPVTAPGAATTDWWDVSAEIMLVSPTDDNAVPAFQMPALSHSQPVEDSRQKDAPQKGNPAGAITLNFNLRHRLAGEIADGLRQIFLGKPGLDAKPSADNLSVLVTAPRDVMTRVETFITVNDWPDAITRGAEFGYPNKTVARAARSFFYACAIEDDVEVFSKQLSPGVLAELKGDTKRREFQDYQMGGTPDAAWEKSLRADWPGKKEAIERLVREWNRYPLKRLVEDPGIALGFGVKHFCSLSFEGAPKPAYQITIEPDRTNPRGNDEPSYLFSSFPPWWVAAKLVTGDAVGVSAMLELPYQLFDQTPHSGWRALAQDGELFHEAAALIETYLARTKLDASQQINLHFHAAQCFAFDGSAKSVLDALGHLKLAHHAVEPPAAPMCWNEYVNATEAFLKGDLAALKAARELLAIGPKVNGVAANLDVVDRLIARFGRPYRDAYHAEPEAPLRPFTNLLSEQTVLERRKRDPSFQLYTVVFKVTADAKGKVQAMNLSRIVDPRAPETKVPELKLPQAYLDVARAKSEASLQLPVRRGSRESISCFSFTPEQPTIVITDLNRPLGRQP